MNIGLAILVLSHAYGQTDGRMDRAVLIGVPQGCKRSKTLVTVKYLILLLCVLTRIQFNIPPD
jgi:hypothetical protein